MVLDPLTAIGLASNVVQFLGFAGSIVMNSAQLYRSANGTLSEDADLSAVTKDLIELNGRLKGSLRRGNDFSTVAAQEKPLEDLISGCVAVAQELLGVLDNLKVKGRFRTWKAIRKGVRSVVRKPELESLQTRLALYREELELNLLISLREQVNFATLEHTKRFDALDKSTKLIAKAIFAKQDVLEILLQKQTDAVTELHVRSDSFNLKEHEKTREELKQFILDHNGVVAEEQIEIQPVYESQQHHAWFNVSLYDQRNMRNVRDTLAYPELMARQSEIADAHGNSFEWIFQGPAEGTRPWNSFVDFLQGDKGLYWTHGKPGAGKSTLLKFLKKNPRTEKALRIWGGKGLLRCSFFFWNSGLAIQRSEEGFLRALLWTVLDKCWPLIPYVLKDETTDANLRMIEKGTFEWTLEMLRRARDRLINQTEYRLFLLIDGLDEFEGDHTAMANWILQATKSASIKIVVSSRPWNAFREAFGNVPQLRLQDLTTNDIKNYVESHLMSHDKMKELIRKEPGKATKLISDIVEKADGVFLWVRVVVFSFLEGLRNHDKLSELQSRLLALPSDLESLYEHMLQKTDTFYGGIQSKYILMRLASRQPPPTLVFSLADDDDLEESLNTDAVERMTRGEAIERCEEMERRLQASCAGLLEVDYREPTTLTTTERYKRLDIVDLYNTAYGSKIQFIHRTARDFFERPDVLRKLQSAPQQQKSFEPNLTMSRGWALALIKLPTGGSGYEVATMLGLARGFADQVQGENLKQDVHRVRKLLMEVNVICTDSGQWIRAKYRLKSGRPADRAAALPRVNTADSDASDVTVTVVRRRFVIEPAVQVPVVATEKGRVAVDVNEKSRPGSRWRHLLCCGAETDG